MVLLDSRPQASQWDYGLVALFGTDDSVSVGTEIHFAKQGSEEDAITRLVELKSSQLVCSIPDSLLEDARTILMYAYVDTGTEGRTIKRWRLQVFPRSKPDGHVGTDEEKKRWVDLESRLATEVTNRTTAEGIIQAEVESQDDRITALEQGGGSGGAVSSVNGQTGAVVLGASDVGALPDDTPIPDAYDDTEVRGLIAAKYTKPSSGIPKTDLASSVKTSLNKADSALQAVPDTYRTAADQDILDSTKVNTDDSRLSDARTPTAHTHQATQVSYGNTTVAAELQSLNSNLATKEGKHKILSSTLATGETSLTFTDASITANSLISIYTDKWGTMPTEVSQSGGSVVLTFTAQSQDIAVKVEVQ